MRQANWFAAFVFLQFLSGGWKSGDALTSHFVEMCSGSALADLLQCFACADWVVADFQMPVGELVQRNRNLHGRCRAMRAYFEHGRGRAGQVVEMVRIKVC